MLTPIEIQGITFKNGRGYKKDDVDSFMKALHHDYEIMYKENMELKEKVNTLSEGVQYYKNLEKTLQKALVLAEKTSEETKIAAQKNAETIENEAKLRAERIIYEARQEMHQIESKTQELLQQFELYKLQYKQIVTSQLELVNSKFDIQIKETQDKSIKQKEIKIPRAVQENKDEGTTIKKEKQTGLVADDKIDLEKKIPSKQEKEISTNKNELKRTRKYTDDLNIEKELASSIEKMEKESNPYEQSVPHKEEKENATSCCLKEDSDDQETDLEIKMLQKLLNEIKKNNEVDTDGEKLEFIDTDSDKE